MKKPLDKTFINDIKIELITKYGDDKACKIWKYANAEYLKLKADKPDADKADRSRIFPVVAVYRAIEHYDKENALSVTRAYGTKKGLKMKKKYLRITSLPGIPALMWKNMKKIIKKLCDGYEVKNLQVDESKCFMDVTGCPLYDRAQALGTPEAVQMICCMDKEYMNGFRGVDYKRTKSVAEGDDCCDYRLTKSF